MKIKMGNWLDIDVDGVGLAWFLIVMAATAFATIEMIFKYSK